MFKRKTPYQKGMNALKDKKFGVAKKELLKASDDANNPDGSRHPRLSSPLTVHRVSAHDKLGILFYRYLASVCSNAAPAPRQMFTDPVTGTVITIMHKSTSRQLSP